MSQRNPMNDRYNTDDHKGVTRKSAASAKPKAQAASSVTIVTAKKTPQEKKADAKAERKKAQEEQRRLDRKYYKPDTQRYKTLRRLWWVCLVAAIAAVAISFFGRDYMPNTVAITLVIVAYGLIIAAFYIDFSKIKKERRAYQDRMVLLEAQQLKEQKEKERLEQQQKKSHKKNSGKNSSRNPKVQAEAAARNAVAREAREAAEKVEEDAADDRNLIESETQNKSRMGFRFRKQVKEEN